MASSLKHRLAAIGSLCAAPLLAAASGAEALRPGSLLFYYGHPALINGASSVSEAAAEFGRYDYVVWGEAIENPAHPDHANAVAIIADEGTAATRIFGYVDLGVASQNLPMTEIEARITSLRQMGADGVLLDNFGYDFATDRARQNAAVDFAHAQGLAVIAGPFQPADAFGREIDPVYNPSGVATSLGASDFYLYESHGVRLGEYEDGVAWRQKSDSLETYRQALGFRVLSITTTAIDGPGAYDEGRFFYAWHAALLSGHAATGWGEFGYSASGMSNCQAPYRARPTLDPGTSFTGPVHHEETKQTRDTDQGRIWLDTSDHTFGFSPSNAGIPMGNDAGRARLTLAPNPVRAAGRVTFILDRPAAAVLALCDLHGRRLATLIEGELAAGPHELPWTGLDDAGRRVAAGCYFLVLETAGKRSVTRVTVVR
jgi:hypothetical protein